MGQVYDVRGKFHFRNVEAARKATEQWAQESHIQLSLEKFRGEGVDTNTLRGLVQAVFAGWKCTPFRFVGHSNGRFDIENRFNASYGWELVMVEWFEVMAPHLYDNSSLSIYPDSGYEMLTIKNGNVEWKGV